MIRERWIITIYVYLSYSFFKHHIMEERAFDGQCFLGFGMAALFVISVYQMFSSLVKDD